MSELKDIELKTFWTKINEYTILTDEAKNAWGKLLKKRTINRNELFIREGEVPKKVGFIIKGLLYQYFVTSEGDTVVKHFFCEGRIAGSVPATLSNVKSDFNIQAIEDTCILEYDFRSFKKLTSVHPSIAAFYINYMEKHWVIEKEPIEISLRKDHAAVRYAEFIKHYPTLVKRLKKHQIASYLGITPTQLSRILFANK